MIIIIFIIITTVIIVILIIIIIIIIINIHDCLAEGKIDKLLYIFLNRDSLYSHFSFPGICSCLQMTKYIQEMSYKCHVSFYFMCYRFTSNVVALSH